MEETKVQKSQIVKQSRTANSVINPATLDFELLKLDYQTCHEGYKYKW